jgi:lipid II:glycine glycyltransferase (peptidoglycan interpeptide bridge formation enzyme)
MQLKVDRSPGPEWVHLIDRLNGNIYHSQEWAETWRSDYSMPLFFRGLDEQGRCVGIALANERHSSRPVIGRFLRRLDFETFPAVQANDPDLARAMMGQLVEFAKAGGYRGLTLQSHYSAVPLSNLDHLGLDATPRIEFIVDLTRSEEDRWKQLSTHHQRKIKKAGKHGLVFEEACTAEAMQELRRLQIGSRDRRMERGEYFGLQDEVYYEQMGRRYFERNLGRLFLMRYKGQPVSAAFISMYSGQALYVLGGSAPKGFELDAPAVLFWKVLSRCVELGCREFNFGGVPASAQDPQSVTHGLYRFKAGFGGRQAARVSGTAENLQSGFSALATTVKRFRLSA